jgi:ribose/xylose/arabinose/galactoside ABC-type transport system permease subunit
MDRWVERTASRNIVVRLIAYFMVLVLSLSAIVGLAVTFVALPAYGVWSFYKGDWVSGAVGAVFACVVLLVLFGVVAGWIVNRRRPPP